MHCTLYIIHYTLYILPCIITIKLRAYLCNGPKFSQVKVKDLGVFLGVRVSVWRVYFAKWANGL